MDSRQLSDLAIIGLGVMGENLALNLHRHGFRVTGFDLEEHRRASFASRTDAAAPRSLQELVASLRTPRVLLLMARYGQPTLMIEGPRSAPSSPPLTPAPTNRMPVPVRSSIRRCVSV